MTTSFKFLALPSFCRQARIQKDREEVSAQQDAAMQSAQSRNIINPEPLERIDLTKAQMENSILEGDEGGCISFGSWSTNPWGSIFDEDYVIRSKLEKKNSCYFRTPKICNPNPFLF